MILASKQCRLFNDTLYAVFSIRERDPGSHPRQHKPAGRLDETELRTALYSPDGLRVGRGTGADYLKDEPVLVLDGGRRRRILVC